LIAFVNEEPPNFREETMGSLQAARRSATARERITGMLSLESLGYYRTEPGSQQYPWPLSHFYPDTADFVAFVGNLASRPLVQQSLAAFREVAQMPSEGTAAPGLITGVGWSDHWSYWQQGYPAVMITGTAPFRNPGYHQAADRPESLDPVRMAWIVVGLRAIVETLSNE
jgi:Zn-dependent M28 family amino/carboxypeptidase